MKQTYRCWAEVDLGALRENLQWIRHRVGPDVKIMTVVKADAYGHGLRQIAALLMQNGTDIFGVANLAEARSIRSVGRGWPILMLGACLPDEVESAVRDEVMPTISSFKEARLFSTTADKMNKVARLHLKVDTGMGRLGMEPEKALRTINQIQSLENVELEGLYTHYSSVEDDARISREQANRFRKLVEEVRRHKIPIPFIHVNNSGALLHETGTMYNLVRPGLLVYGVAPNGKRTSDMTLQRHLRPVLSLKCRVSFIKVISKGSSLSYGGTFVAARKMRVATLAAGYGDGYMRAASNRASVLVGGRRCPVLGRITMDQMIVDVSHLPGVEVGDEAVLIGCQRDEEISAIELGTWSGTIPWEVLTNINQRVPRLYSGGQAA